MAELGNHNTVLSVFDGNGVGDGYVAGPFGAGISGTITDFWFYVKPGVSTSVYRGLLYASSGSDPGALLSTLPEHTVNDIGTDPTERWITDTGLSVAFTGPIYIGFWQGPSTPTLNYSYDGAGATFYSAAANFGAYSSTNPAINPWPTATDLPGSTQKVAVYVVYTPSVAVAAPNLIVNQGNRW